MGMENPALYYHERTKHYPWRYARSLGYLDWDTQPNPFRFWEGAEVIRLPLLEDPSHPPLALYDLSLVGEEPFTLENLSKFLELALGLSAWKSAGGSTWAVRMNPSSGNLHPTECYLILPDVAGLRGVFHYNPFLHALEKVRDIPAPLARAIKEHFKTEGFIAVLTSIPWRESWKYGERALRYCLLDTGHAIGSLRFSANLKGWRVKWLSALGDGDLKTLLGFDKVEFPEGEEEFPELALFVFPKSTPDVERDIPPQIVEAFKDLPFYGKPNVLSPDRVIWEIVYTTAREIEKPRTSPLRFSYGDRPLRVEVPYKLRSAEEIIRTRRSGHIYDPNVWIDKAVFLQMLDRTLPRDSFSPFDVEISPTFISLVLFVHRVRGIPKGLYTFIRNERHLNLFRERFKRNFLWEEVEENLYLLAEGDTTDIAAYLSCMQEIAGNSAFAAAMVAEFEPVVSRAPWLYRNIHWEAGLIGQVLYLEATGYGIKGTGIGCFFDDLTHEVLGLAEIRKGVMSNLLEPEVEVDRSLQVVYHFTVGGAYEDPRIQTIPPYHHLERV
ncbi:MAG TPA: SagB/ThcOx family dehydrogenase [Aquificales bacterium]|nr:SagB/ThcOx family dehydrogenase [Aquificales bacterium]